MIVGCSEIDLFPAPALPANTPSICVQLEILPDQKIWRHRMFEFDGREGDTYYASFETSEDYSKNGKPIYMYESDAGRMYYVFSDGDRWIVSSESIRLEGMDVLTPFFAMRRIYSIARKINGLSNYYVRVKNRVGQQSIVSK